MRHTLLLLLAFASLALGACNSTSQGTSGAAKGDSGASELSYAMPPAPRTPPDKLPARIVEHLEGLHFVGQPLKEHCDVFGEDMNAYLDHYKADFTDAAKVELSAEQRQAIGDAYTKSSEVTTRCLQDEEGRRFNQRLINLTQPLKPKPAAP